MTPRLEVVQAPNSIHISDRPSIFLGGTTTGRNWREDLIKTLADLPVVVLNPLRTDWDSTWTERVSDERWLQQVEWELQMQESADTVALFFDATTTAPVSLLELGLCARLGKAVVCAHPNYPKRGNVELVCRRFAIPLFEDPMLWQRAIHKELKRLSITKDR